MDADAVSATIVLRKEHQPEDIRASLLANIAKQISENSREFRDALSRNCTINRDEVDVTLRRGLIKGQFSIIFLPVYKAMTTFEKAKPLLVVVDGLDDCTPATLALVFDFFAESLTHISSLYFLVSGHAAYRKVTRHWPTLLSSIESVTIS